jgi:hypothetical protein
MDAGQVYGVQNQYEKTVMSAETYIGLSEAISAHVGAELGDDVSLVRDWVLVASVSDIHAQEGREEIVVHRSPGTPLYAVSGLLQWGSLTISPEDLLDD